MNALAEFHFLRPLWLFALLLIPMLLWAWRRHARNDNPWRRVVDPHLLPALLEAGPAQSRRSPRWLLWSVPLLSILALAGPAWQKVPEPLLRAESALVVALDLSERMQVADLAPSRLQRARFKIADLLRERRDGQIGLLAYAGDAFTVAPLTSDSATLESLLGALYPDLMPVPGQRADRAIEQAVQLIHDAGFASGQLLLLTDRADSRDQRAAAAAAAEGITVSVLGVGTPQGAPIPLPGGNFATDPSGKPVMAALDVASLQALAAAGGGRYATIDGDAGDLRRLGVLEPGGATTLQADDARSAPRYRDHGPWLLLLVLPLAALGFRRGWLGCVPLLLLLQPAPAQAIDWDALWWRRDQRAQQALEQGDHERARALASDPLRQGAAAYRGGDYQAAIDALAAADSADAHYNRGNALARAGQLEQAIDAYDEALSRQPGMPDALANREAVERALQQQQQQQQDAPPQEQQQGEQDQQQQGDQQQRQQQQGDDGEPPPGEQPPPDGEPGADEADEPADQPSGSDQGEAPPPPADDPQAEQQQQQALGREIDEALQNPPAGQATETPDPREQESRQVTEQLLRRVPDDPGGLLRRKFALEHRRRASEGNGDER